MGPRFPLKASYLGWNWILGLFLPLETRGQWAPWVGGSSPHLTSQSWLLADSSQGSLETQH